MPLFPYLPMIVWMGVIQIALGLTNDHDAQSADDPANLTMKRGTVVPLRMPFKPAA
jgi:hypothetical protein